MKFCLVWSPTCRDVRNEAEQRCTRRGKVTSMFNGLNLRLCIILCLGFGFPPSNCVFEDFHDDRTETCHGPSTGPNCLWLLRKLDVSGCLRQYSVREPSRPAESYICIEEVVLCYGEVISVLVRLAVVRPEQSA
jgi:hypothetical protein